MAKKENKKRNQHYVPQYYQEGWANENGQVFCLRNGKIFQSAPRNNAAIRDYYRMVPLSPDEKIFIYHFVDNWPPGIKKGALELIETFFAATDILDSAEKQDKDENLSSMADVKKNNLIEDMFSQIEGEANPLLERLRNGDALFWDDEDEFGNFLYNLCMQYSRTKQMENRARVAMPIRYQNSYSILRHLLGLMLFAKINAEWKEWSLTLLHNTTSIKFITGGQPTVNLCPQINDDHAEMILYYPVSPDYACILRHERGKPHIYVKVDISEKEIIEYNNKIFDESGGHIIATDDNELKHYI